MNENDEQSRILRADNSPTWLQIDHGSVITWHTWALLYRSYTHNRIFVYAQNQFTRAATVAMQLSIFGVNAPTRFEWWLYANRKEGGDWMAKIVPVTAVDSTVKITSALEDHAYWDDDAQKWIGGIKAVRFDVILDTNPSLYVQGDPFYGLKIFSNDRDVVYELSRGGSSLAIPSD